MRGIGVSLGVLAALLGSTALVQAQSGGVSAAAGVIALSLPAVETGAFGTGDIDLPSEPTTTYGISFGGDAYIDLGQHGDFDVFIGASGFGAIASGTSSTAMELEGQGALVIPGYTTPTDYDITLTTNSVGLGGAVSANSTTNQDGETNGVDLAPGTGAAFGWGVNPDDDFGTTPAFLFGGVFADSDDDRSGAFGAVADEDGSILIAIGDLTGVVVTQDVTQHVAYYGGDITLGLSGANGNVQLTGYAGPSYLFLGRDVVSTTTVDFPELGDDNATTGGVASPLEFPMYSLTRDETIATHYVGGVAGLSASTPVGEGMLLTIGGEGGLYATHTTATGMETASVFGGDPSPTPDPTEVANTIGLDLVDNSYAFTLGGNAALTVPVGQNMQISFGAGAEYLSRVATLAGGGAPTITGLDSVGSGDDDGSVTYDGSEDLRPVISYGDAWTLSGFLTLSGQF